LKGIHGYAAQLGNSGYASHLYRYGIFGYGKPHIIAALACILLNTDLVIYIPDCGWVLNAKMSPFEVLREAMLLTFAGSDAVFDEVLQTKTVSDLIKFSTI